MLPDMTNFDNELNNSKNDLFYYTVDLLVNVEILKLPNKTSDPKRTHEALSKYLGLQVFHQHKMGLRYFMETMIRKEIFTHEIEILAVKTLHGFKWRREKVTRSMKCNQCKEIIRTRQKLLDVELKAWMKVNRRETQSLRKLIDSLRLRMKR